MKTFKVVKLKSLLAITLLLIIISLSSYFLVKAERKTTSDGFLGYTIVLDAGHGGHDVK